MRPLIVAAKRFVLFLNGLVAASEYLVHGSRPRRGLTILAYHRLASGLPRWPPFDPFNVDPRVFRHQLDELLRLRGSVVVSLRDVMRWVTDASPPLHGSYLMLTFDDGWTHVVQPLADAASRGFPTVVFVPTAYVGAGLFEFSRFDRWYAARSRATAPGVAPLGLTDCRALVASGVDVQPHGHTHRSLGNLPDREMRLEISQSVEIIKRELGVDASALAYPYGTSTFDDCTPEVERALRELGIRLALRSDPGVNKLEDLPRDALRLKRVAMTDFDVGIVFRAKASGYLGLLPLLTAGFHGLRRSAGLNPTAR